MSLMNITECVPLAGRGLVARRGHLVALTGGMDAGPGGAWGLWAGSVGPTR